MMTLLQLILSIFLLQTAESGWLAAGGAYYSCMGACTSGAAAGGLMASVSTMGLAAPAAGGAVIYGAAACATVCSSLAGGTAFLLPGLCFAQDTFINTDKFGAIPIQQISVGMNVQTFDLTENIQIWSEVVVNDIINITQHHTRISIQTEYEANNESIMVTDAHWMIHFDVDGNGNILNNYKLSQAQDLKIGDVIPLIKNESVIKGNIIDIEKIVLPYTYQLGTKYGTVIANKVLTTTICDGNAIPYSIVNDTDINTVIQIWQNKHSFQ